MYGKQKRYTQGFGGGRPEGKRLLGRSMHRWEVNQSHYRPEVPRGFQEVKVPRLRDNGPVLW